MNKIYQVSLLQALVSGYYDGVISVSELKEKCDVAIGTFEGADGEMIMLDNKVYKAKVDGTVVEANNSELIPFANGAKFVIDDIIKVSSSNIKDFKKNLDDYINNHYKNDFVIIKINGLFKGITVRSIPKQNKPYKPLDYVVDNMQKVYTYENIRGTIIGFKNPYFMNNINTTDYHMHFISSDLSKGGHVLDLDISNLDVLISIKNSLELKLPENIEFNSYDFNVKNDIIKKVEE
jgi:acetolactate decarboxylase